MTGSSDGLGLLAGKALVEQGHAVVLHARSEERADDARSTLPECEAVVVGDVSLIEEMKRVAAQVNALGRFDAVIHNVGIGYRERNRVETVDGLSKLFAVNVAAPYVLTALVERPARLVYLSSSMQAGGDGSLEDLQWETRRWNGSQAYADSKLHDLILAMTLARRWPETLVNAVDPGWVPTRMGGVSAPDDLAQGADTQAWLAISDDSAARVSGKYFYHRRPRSTHHAAGQTEVQERLIDYLQQMTGVKLT